MIKWEGGQQPVANDVVVIVHFENGTSLTRPANEFMWSNTNAIDNRITHYDLVKPLTREQAIHWCIDNLDKWPDSIGADSFTTHPAGWRWGRTSDEWLLCGEEKQIAILKNDWQSQPYGPESALQWCVDNIVKWPDSEFSGKNTISPEGWEWWNSDTVWCLADNGNTDIITSNDWRGAQPLTVPECFREQGPLNTQVAGDHYKKLAIQPVEYAMKNNLNYCQANAIKYITRYKDKGGIEDLEKAKHCIDLMIGFENET